MKKSQVKMHKLVLEGLAICLEEEGIECVLRRPDNYNPDYSLDAKAKNRLTKYDKAGYCTVMFGERPGTVRLDRCPGLISLLLAEPDSIKVLCSSINYCFMNDNNRAENPDRCSKCPGNRKDNK